MGSIVCPPTWQERDKRGPSVTLKPHVERSCEETFLSLLVLINFVYKHIRDIQFPQTKQKVKNGPNIFFILFAIIFLSKPDRSRDDD